MGLKWFTLPACYHDTRNQNGKTFPWCSRHLHKLLELSRIVWYCLLDQLREDGLLVGKVAVGQPNTDLSFSGNICDRRLHPFARKDATGTLQDLCPLCFADALIRFWRSRHFTVPFQ